MKEAALKGSSEWFPLFDFLEKAEIGSVVAGGMGSENWLERGADLNCGGGYMTTYICQNSSNYNLKGWILLYVSDTIILFSQTCFKTRNSHRWMNLKNADWKKPDSKKYILYAPIYMPF